MTCVTVTMHGLVLAKAPVAAAAVVWAVPFTVCIIVPVLVHVLANVNENAIWVWPV